VNAEFYKLGREMALQALQDAALGEPGISKTAAGRFSQWLTATLEAMSRGGGEGAAAIRKLKMLRAHGHIPIGKTLDAYFWKDLSLHGKNPYAMELLGDEFRDFTKGTIRGDLSGEGIKRFFKSKGITSAEGIQSEMPKLTGSQAGRLEKLYAKPQNPALFGPVGKLPGAGAVKEAGNPTWAQRLVEMARRGTAKLPGMSRGAFELAERTEVGLPSYLRNKQDYIRDAIRKVRVARAGNAARNFMPPPETAPLLKRLELAKHMAPGGMDTLPNTMFRPPAGERILKGESQFPVPLP
jgi:hypothetical protein